MPPLKSPPARGRDRALSAAPKKKPPPPPIPVSAPVPYEFSPPEVAAKAAVDVTKALPADTAPRPFATAATPFPGKRIGRWLVALAAVGIGLAITLPFTLGVYYGNQQRQAYVERQAIEHFQRALAYESETYTELAIAELNAALQYKPDYQPARDKLEQLKNARTVTTAQEPQDVSIAKQLYDSAQQALANRSWSDAIDLFEELRRVKSDYQASDVTTRLVTAYVASGKEALAAKDVELAQRRFDAALALAPDNAEARTFRDRSILYTNGTTAMGSDYPTAVVALTELYQRDPNFGDVKEKLSAAHAGYADLANQQGAFCIAAREYDAAVALGASTEVATLAAAANASCKQAILNPTAAPPPTLEGAQPLEGFVTPAPFGAPPAFTTPLPGAKNALYTPQLRVRQNARCDGTGDIKGSVQDGGGNPIPNVGVKIYNDYGYLPPYARTDAAGEYLIGLGSDKGLFRLVIVDDFGSNVSAVLNVDYPGGNVQGCHIVVTWTRVR